MPLSQRLRRISRVTSIVLSILGIPAGAVVAMVQEFGTRPYLEYNGTSVEGAGLAAGSVTVLFILLSRSARRSAVEDRRV